MEQRAESIDVWCSTCHTRHDGGCDCPGELLATGPERHGFRVLVHTPHGTEVFGTLVAPAGPVWRARILTFPNVLWVGPRGATLKFVGRAPAEADARAAEFIREHCRRCGFATGKEVPAVEAGPVVAEQTAQAGPAEAGARRHPCGVVVRFGVDRPDREATTDDLSERGMFLRAERLLPVGTPLRLYVDVGGFGLPMRGVVRWIRAGGQPGRPAGMGIHIVLPHPRWVQFARERFPDAPAGEDAPTYEAGGAEADGAS
jgi:hypothetical protein